MHELWDIKGQVAVAINVIAAGVAWGMKWAGVHFASIASEFIAKEVLPPVTLIAVITTTVLAVLNRRDKLRLSKKLSESQKKQVEEME